ncbi:MAG: enoyl-CoA hydratase/isomerase family protein [Deltaproteobacteria bacterium]|nr:enoyl-CoA hydratase/isomerase family protein [Deltaproteobacteria bacterium]MBW2077358.1 enoyl-CoA hydratase/isomerase family protein [Deltaproteobacteria bacterium]
MEEIRYRIEPEVNIAIFEIDTPGPVNTIGQRLIADLLKATQRARDDGVKGVILRSSKKKSFLDGANLMEIMKDPSVVDLKHLTLKFHEALEALARSPFPVVALLMGQTALGGGFEMLLWGCDHIFAAPGSKMGLPEVNVGLFPAGGGPEILRRALGLKAALDIVLGGKVLPAEFYAHSGLVTIAQEDKLPSAARKWIAGHQDIVNRNYDPTWQGQEPLSREEQVELVKKARSRYTVCPQRPYLKAAIDAIEEGLALPFEEAAQNEVRHFAPLIADPHVKNKIDLFFSITSLGPKLAKMDHKKAVPTPEIAIIGAGLMGQGVAQVCADNGMKALLIDIDKPTVQAAVEKISAEVELLVQKGRWQLERKERLLRNIRVTDDYKDLKGIPLVIEAVFEDLALKQEILKKAQEANPDVLFASNTSTIPMEDISAKSDRPDQVVGMHYFSPVPLMPLLEVVQGPKTSDSALATAVTSGRQQGKTCIIVGDGPGFYTSRTFGVFVMTGFYLIEMGLNPWEIDRLALEAGFPQGPLHVYGTAGGNVVYHAGSFMQSRRPDIFSVPKTLINLYEAGYVGAGKPCFYEKGLKPDTSVLDYIDRTSSLPTPDSDEAKEMLLLAMVNQAFMCLDDGVLRDYYSMDIGAILGIGFPDCWHGPARYVSQKGVRSTLKRLEEIYDKYGIPFFRPAQEFERLIACGVDKALI